MCPELGFDDIVIMNCCNVEGESLIPGLKGVKWWKERETKDNDNTHQLYSGQLAIPPDPIAHFRPDPIRHGRCTKALAKISASGNMTLQPKT
jgi:hypothetical protein